MKPLKTKDGYLQVILSKDGETKHYYLHRLVAEAYIPNPGNKSQVNHKDEDKTHNWISNLEWTTAQENSNYGSHDWRKKVRCVELDREFESTHEAARQLGISQSNISACCKGKRKTCGGYHWHYLP